MKKLVFIALLMLATTLLFGEMQQINMSNKYDGSYKEVVYSKDAGQTNIQPSEEIIITLKDGVITIADLTWQVDSVYYDTEDNSYWLSFKGIPIVWEVFFVDNNQIQIFFYDARTQQEVLRVVVEKVNNQPVKLECPMCSYSELTA